ncbi:MAG: hypothetical protein DRP56_09330, partial [Planctomycetota bacterium]
VKNAEGFTLPAKGDGKYKVHVIAGTHWDREWRFTAEQSKVRLAELIDDMMDKLEGNPGYRHFVLDGGAVVLEDYLSVRPENKERLKKLFEQGRTSMVSWYTLPDMNLVSPEATIRNHLVGRRVSKEFGGPMQSGFNATSYGQPAQMPQIYSGFGMKEAFFYRGTNRHQTPPTCWWDAPDGSRVLLVRGFDEVTRANWSYFAIKPIVRGSTGDQLKSLGGIYTAKDIPVHMADMELCEMPFKSLCDSAEIPDDKAFLLEKYDIFRKQAYKQAIGRHVLGLDIDDNASPWTGQVEFIDKLNKVLDDTEIVQSSMDEFVEAITEEVEGVDLHVINGEVRHPLVEYGWNGLYAMIASVRVKMKLLNEQAETSLILVAEPLASFATALGTEYPRAILNEAWLTLLKNHSHDSICGAAIDSVQDDMDYRFRQVRTVSEEIGKRAIEDIWCRIDRSHCNEKDQTLTLFNTLAHKRSGVQALVLDLPVADFKTDNYQHSPTEFVYPDLFDILDEDGEAIDYEVTDIQAIEMGMETIESGSQKIDVKRHRILMSVDLPPMGYRSFVIRKHQPRYVFNPQPGKANSNIAQPGGIMENQFLRVDINSNGTFNLTDKQNGRVFDKLHYFDDRVSTSVWPHLDSPALRNQCVTSLGLNAIITMDQANSQRGVYRIQMNLPVPKEATGDWYRSCDTVDIPITTWLTLDKGGRRVDIRTKIDNRAKDHRLFVMFPTGMKTDHVAVETPFMVERRNFIPKDIGDNTECDYRFQPMHNFIDMADDKSGLAIFNKGMREYAAWDDPNRTVSLTLLRTYRAYINANTNMTPEELEKYPGTHSPGILEFNYSLCPHAGDWRQGNVMTEAYDFKTPVRAIQGPGNVDAPSMSKIEKLPPTQSFFEIEPAGKVMLSALCQSEDGDGTIMRIWNTTDEPIEAKIRTTLPFKSASKVNMGETEVVDQLKLSGGAVTVPMRKAEITTIKFWFNSNKVGRNC